MKFDSWGVFLNHYHGCCISCCCHRTSLCHCYGGESPLRLDLFLPTHSYSELHSSLNFQHFLTSDPKEPVIMFQLKVMTLITAQFWWDVTVLVLGATGSYWFQQRLQRLSFPQEMAQLTASLHCARRRAEQMKDSNYHDMTWHDMAIQSAFRKLSRALPGHSFDIPIFWLGSKGMEFRSKTRGFEDCSEAQQVWNKLQYEI